MGKDYGFGKCSNINARENEMKMDYSENQSLLTKLRYAKSPNIRARSSGSKYHDILLMKLRKDKKINWLLKYIAHLFYIYLFRFSIVMAMHDFPLELGKGSCTENCSKKVVSVTFVNSNNSLFLNQCSGQRPIIPFRS